VFDIGAFTSGLLTGLREGVEAALIVSIICAYLARTGNARHLGRIGLGVAAAVAASSALGLVIFATLGELQTPWEQVFEGTTMLVAAAVVTWMLFWMRRQASSVAGQLQRALDRVLTAGSAWGLALLAFTAVIREGLETALFLVGQATAATTSVGGAGAASVLAGATVGLLISAGLGYGLYRGSRRLNLGRFFRWTGVLLVFIAAGLLGSARVRGDRLDHAGHADRLRHQRDAAPRGGHRPLPAGPVRLLVHPGGRGTRHLGHVPGGGPVALPAAAPSAWPSARTCRSPAHRPMTGTC
jgi:FTR1 family protein